MIKYSKQVSTRLVMILCILLISIGFNHPTIAHDDANAKGGHTSSIGYTNLQSQINHELEIEGNVTTGSAIEIVPTTTPQSIDIRFYADQAIVQATTEAMIQVNIEVGNIEQVNMFEVEVVHDTNQLTYIEEMLPLEESFLINKKEKDGMIKIQFGTLKKQELQNGKKVIQMKFRTRDNLQEGEEIIIKLNQCDVSTINDLGETQIYQGIIVPKVLMIQVVEEEARADINKDGKVNLEDLAIATKYYGVDNTQAIWEKAEKCDVIPDGMIDMRDLMKISIKSDIKY